MNIKYLLGLFQIIVAIVIFLNFSFSRIYPLLFPGISFSGGAIWWWIDILIALGLVIAAVISFQRKRAVDRAGGQQITREYLEANLLFWAMVISVFWFLRSWFAFLLGLDNDYAWWTEIDTLVLLVLYPCGAYLMRTSKNDD